MVVVKNNFKRRFTVFCIKLAPLLLVLLFAYTGASKLLGHQKMLAQLEQSGLPEPLPQLASYAVPVVELVIALLLSFERSRLAGLWGACLAMLFFTGYVAFILSGKNIPCSCGGVIAKMNWQQHLYFNIFFLLVSILSLYYHKRYYAHNKGVS
jgi:putative oxidoreductase